MKKISVIRLLALLLGILQSKENHSRRQSKRYNATANSVIQSVIAEDVIIRTEGFRQPAVCKEYCR